MKSLTAQPLRHQIVVVTCVLLLIMAVAIVWVASRTQYEREHELAEETKSTAALVSAYLDRYFDGLDSTASLIVQNPAVVALSAPQGTERLHALVTGHQALVRADLRDADGRMIASAGRTAGAAVALTPGYVSHAIRTGRTTASELYTDPASGDALGLAYPVRNPDGAVVGALTLVLELAHLRHVLASFALPAGSVVMLIDQQGHVAVQTNDQAVRVRTASVSIPAADAGMAADVRTDADGIDRFVASTPLAGRPWFVSVGVPRSVVSDRLAGIRRRNLTFVAVAVLAVLSLALWVSHQTSDGLNKLRLAAHRIATGDLSPPAPINASSLEIAELYSAFVTMAGNLRAAREDHDRQVEEERKIRETVQGLQRQVVRQERLAAVGLLVSGVAHELNNPLQAILGTAELLERSPNLDAEMAEELTLLKAQSSRARDIIRNLARFANQTSAPSMLVDLSQVAADVVQLRRHDLENAGIEVELDVRTATPVFANVTELEQVALNFVINAQQAIQAEGRSPGRILLRVVDSGLRVRLEVHDNGPGVPPENEAKLFQPFFTTKPIGKGTGLGLSISYGIIESYGGVIGCHRSQWGGAVFFFELPAAKASDGRVAASSGV